MDDIISGITCADLPKPDMCCELIDPMAYIHLACPDCDLEWWLTDYDPDSQVSFCLARHADNWWFSETFMPYLNRSNVFFDQTFQPCHISEITGCTLNAIACNHRCAAL